MTAVLVPPAGPKATTVDPATIAAVLLAIGAHRVFRDDDGNDYLHTATDPRTPLGTVVAEMEAGGLVYLAGDHRQWKMSDGAHHRMADHALAALRQIRTDTAETAAVRTVLADMSNGLKASTETILAARAEFRRDLAEIGVKVSLHRDYGDRIRAAMNIVNTQGARASYACSADQDRGVLLSDSLRAQLVGPHRRTAE